MSLFMFYYHKITVASISDNRNKTNFYINEIDQNVIFVNCNKLKTEKLVLLYKMMKLLGKIVEKKG